MREEAKKKREEAKLRESRSSQSIKSLGETKDNRESIVGLAAFAEEEEEEEKKEGVVDPPSALAAASPTVQLPGALKEVEMDVLNGVNGNKVTSPTNAGTDGAAGSILITSVKPAGADEKKHDD
jgi:hypothetical protein